MSSSQSLMEGLKHLVRCPITFVCVVNFKGIYKLFCLGHHSFLLLTEDLEKIDCEIYLAHIETILMDFNRHNVIQLQLSENRDGNIPAKMIFVTDDRKLLINYLSSAWKTDYMYRKGKIKSIPLFKCDFSSEMKELEFVSQTTLPNFVTDPFEYCADTSKFELKQYCFFLPGEFEPQKQVGVYLSRNNKNCKIFLQISDTMPLDVIPQLRDREDLKYYAQIFADSIMGDTDYWIISSKIYYKRNNYTMDEAQWSGWEINLRERKRDTLILILRRKYIPPILDVFQDFAIVMRGPTTDVYDKNISKKYLNIVRNMADSLYAITSLHSTNQSNIYKMLIEQKANGLLLNEETYFFFQYKKDLKPKHLSFGVKYLKSILQILSKIGYSTYINELETKYPKEYKEDLEERNSNNVISIPSKLLNAYFQGQDNNSKKIWLYKLSRYLSYCVDGGLLNGQFNLVDILKNYENSDNPSELIVVINFLLHLTPEKGDIEREFYEDNSEKKFTYSLIHDKIKKIYSTPHIFNEKVMKVLIENDFFSNEFKRISNTTNEPPLAYAEFLIHLMSISKSSSLKASICRHIISYQSELKKVKKDNKEKNEDEYMKTVFKTLNKPLIEMYKSSNRTLATLASVALLNICWNSKDLKYLMVFEGVTKVALDYLSTKDESLLRYSLQLVLSLCSVFQNMENFLKLGLMPKLLNLVEGSKIPDTTTSPKVISLVFQIIKIIIGNTDKNIDDIEQKIPFFTKLLFEVYNNNEETTVEILGVLRKLALKNINSKKTIGIKIVKYSVENLEKRNSPKINEAILQLICVLAKDSETFIEELENNNVKAVIKKIINKEDKNTNIFKQGQHLINLMMKEKKIS